MTTTSSASRPERPIRRIAFRWDSAAGRFRPCSHDDRRVTVLDRVDARGRVVIEDERGLHVAHPSRYYDPADGRAWLEAEAQRRRTTRKDGPR